MIAATIRIGTPCIHETSKRRRKLCGQWIFAGALALGLSLAAIDRAAAGAAQAQQSPKASVGYYPGALISLPAFIANDQKFFDKNGLTVQLVPISTGPAMTSAVASGSVTFVNNSWDNLLVAVEQGLPVRGVLGSTSNVPFAFIARNGLAMPHLKDGYPAVIKDLVGKKWGVLALGVSVQYIEQTLLTDAGFKADAVTYLAVGLPNTARPALQRGTVDTYLSIEPLPSIVEAKHEGTVVLDLARNQGPAVFHDLGYNGWWASTSTINDKPEVVSALREGDGGCVLLVQQAGRISTRSSRSCSDTRKCRTCPTTNTRPWSSASCRATGSVSVADHRHLGQVVGRQKSARRAAKARSDVIAKITPRELCLHALRDDAIDRCRQLPTSSDISVRG